MARFGDLGVDHRAVDDEVERGRLRRPAAELEAREQDVDLDLGCVGDELQPHTCGHRDHEAELDVHDLVAGPAREPAEDDPVVRHVRVERAGDAHVVDADLLHLVTTSCGFSALPTGSAGA